MTLRVSSSDMESFKWQGFISWTDGRRVKVSGQTGLGRGAWNLYSDWYPGRPVAGEAVEVIIVPSPKTGITKKGG
jgi:hypothetical protein